MQTWLEIRSTVLDEMVTLDGPGDNKLDFCNSCGNSEATPLYRCLECSYSLLYCSECILKSHTILPLHRLEVCLCFRSRSSYLFAPSAGRRAFSIEPLSTRLVTPAISGMVVTHALWSPPYVNSPSSTSTVGISFRSGFASVVPATCRTTASCFVCAGTPHPSIVRKRLSLLTFSKHTTKSRYKENSTYTTSTIP